MERTITNPIQYGANYEAKRFKPKLEFFYLNKREGGYCECCRQDFQPNELIRKTSGIEYDDTRHIYIFFLCVACDV